MQMTLKTKQFLDQLASWPEEDLEVLVGAAREIQAWRNGEYNKIDEELWDDISTP
jgi:hypothetical protein